MKSLVLLLLLCMSVCSVYAQQISVRELLSFSTKDVEEVNDYLLARGWSFNGVGKTATARTPMGDWRFKKAGYPDGAIASISISQNSDGRIQVLYSVVSKPYFDVVKKQLLTLSATKQYSWTDGDCLRTRYIGYLDKVFLCNTQLCKFSDSNFVFYGITVSY